MKTSGQCPKCGGRDIRRYQPVDGMALSDKRFAIKPVTWAIAYACAACGFIEFYTEGEGYSPPRP